MTARLGWLLASPIIVLLVLLAHRADAAGPWRGQVVDAETGAPLEGVVVLGVWHKVSPGAMHPRREFYDVDEVLTDSDGRFAIPPRSRITANPFVNLDGPRLTMFKPGFGRWRERDIPPFTADRDGVWKQMENKGVTFELPALKTKAERRLALPSLLEAPEERIPRFMEAVDRELLDLGLPPMRPRKGAP
jgi:hypothetical protein